MKAHIDFLLNGQNVTAEAEYNYSVDDNSILTIDTVYLGGAEVWAMLDDYCKAHIQRCARKDWENQQRARAMTRAMQDERKAAARAIVEAAREEYFDDPINRARARV